MAVVVLILTLSTGLLITDSVTLPIKGYENLQGNPARNGETRVGAARGKLVEELLEYMAQSETTACLLYTSPSPRDS